MILEKTSDITELFSISSASSILKVLFTGDNSSYTKGANGLNDVFIGVNILFYSVISVG